jgi:hypothetical protein
MRLSNLNRRVRAPYTNMQPDFVVTGPDFMWKVCTPPHVTCVGELRFQMVNQKIKKWGRKGEAKLGAISLFIQNTLTNKISANVSLLVAGELFLTTNKHTSAYVSICLF